MVARFVDGDGVVMLSRLAVACHLSLVRECERALAFPAKPFAHHRAQLAR
jgi:hypothetical protein